MSQKNRFHIIVKKTPQKPARIFIGQMPLLSKNPLFQIIRIFPNLKHPDIMVCFQKECIQILKIFDNIFIIITKVRRNTNGTFSTFHAITNRLCRVMRNGKRIDGQILNCERLVLSDFIKNPLRKFPKGSALDNPVYRTLRCINPNPVLAC